MGEKNSNKKGHTYFSVHQGCARTSTRPRNIFSKDVYKGQVTLFIILSIVIVGIGVAIYMFYPQLQTTLGIGAKSPTEFIQLCLEEQIQENIGIISANGGSLNPEHYFLYGGGKLEYLCYTSNYYEPCVMQQPFLRQHIEEELENSIAESSRECFEEMKKSYERKGYDVKLNLGKMGIRLFPERVVANFNHTLTLTKEDSERYKDFSIVLNNNLYELVSIAISILNFEAKYGDSETTTYMNFYHDLKVEKKKQGDGTTIYILTNRDTGEKFQFASRSYIWPSGYGITSGAIRE
ncbi:MAG: hypothetical protein ABFQ65_00500 [Nanoarchaeota archaeon]